MVWVSDTYLRAKSAKCGALHIDEGYAAFLAELRRRYHAEPLWLEASTFTDGLLAARPRLSIVFERRLQRAEFSLGRPDCDPRKGARIARLFERTTTPEFREQVFQVPPGRTLDGPMLVTWSSFEETAVIETHDLVSREELDIFGRSLGLGDALWCVERYAGPPTVFVHTARQAAELADSPVRVRWDQAYFDLARTKDEFGYLDAGDSHVSLDSKEIFDRDYSGNWFYYWK